MAGLSLNEVIGILGEDTPYPTPEQHGPLKHFDREMRCANRGCRSPTHFKLKNIPICMIHCLRKMNEMLLELGVEK